MKTLLPLIINLVKRRTCFVLGCTVNIKTASGESELYRSDCLPACEQCCMLYLGRGAADEGSMRLRAQRDPADSMRMSVSEDHAPQHGLPHS